jgi:hypothetical protein
MDGNDAGDVAMVAAEMEQRHAPVTGASSGRRPGQYAVHNILCEGIVWCLD